MPSVAESPDSTSSYVAELDKYEDADSLINNNILFIFLWITVTILCQIIVLFGIGTNIINIICFVKQGFNDAVNVSFLGLAICDLGCLATLIWTNICFTPGVFTADLNFEPIEIQYLTSGIPHTIFTRISGWITAFITLERCLCITAPLKIKHLITSRRVTVIIICIYVILVSSVVPLYSVYSFDTKYIPERNKTILGLVYTENRELFEKVSFATNYVCIPYSAFVVIISCTITLVVKLQENKQWRMSSTRPAQADNVSGRNKKVAKMVVIISTLFVICFFPMSTVFLAMAMNPEFSIGGKHFNVLLVIGGLGMVLESVNSSVNIFIYYYMSSRYRNAFRLLWNTRTFIHITH